MGSFANSLDVAPRRNEIFSNNLYDVSIEEA
jgi:hypothetical protein